MLRSTHHWWVGRGYFGLPIQPFPDQTERVNVCQQNCDEQTVLEQISVVHYFVRLSQWAPDKHGLGDQVTIEANVASKCRSNSRLIRNVPIDRSPCQVWNSDGKHPGCFWIKWSKTIYRFNFCLYVLRLWKEKRTQTKSYL